MSDKDQLSTLTSQLADIELPAEPDWWPVYVFIFVALVILSSALQLVRLRYRQTTKYKHDVMQEAIQQLERLQQQWQGNECSDQRAAFRLAAILRLGLSLSQLTATPPTNLVAAEQQNWQSIVKQLHQLRYNPKSTLCLDETIFLNCRRWLDQTAKQKEQAAC